MSERTETMTWWTTAVTRSGAHLPHWLRFSRYLAGSVICFGVSEVVLIALFAPHLLGVKSASIVASIAGVIPGYTLNRRWTFGVQGKSDFWREVVPYWVIAVASTVAAAFATDAANDLFLDQSRLVRTLLNAAAYMITYGVIFVVKYVIFNKWLFKRPAPALPVSEAAAVEVTA